MQETNRERDEDPLKSISHVSYSDRLGGAAIAAFRLHRGLQAIGAASTMVVRDKITEAKDVVELEILEPEPSHRSASWLFKQKILDKIATKRTERSNSMFVLPYPGLDLTSLPPIRRSAVINLHWVSFIFSPTTLARLKTLNKPIVWTLHDQNPMTGGCHYGAGCREFEFSCASCPQLIGGGYGLTSSILAEKFEALRGLNLTVVSPSKWLADCARKSKMFRDFPVREIPYSLDLEIYNPERRSLAREKLAIEDGTVCFLFGAYGLGERRKGFGILLAALQRCLAEPDFREDCEGGKIRFLAMGKPNNPDLDKFGISYTALGYLEDEREIAAVYSAADVLLLPSIEDNYPNMMVEALACGVPIVGFAIGGLRDLVGERGLGLLVPNIDSRALAAAICRIYREPQLRRELGKKARAWMERTHSLEVQAGKYLELYGELCGAKRSEFLTGVRRSDGNELAAFAGKSSPGLKEDFSIGTSFWRDRKGDRPFAANLSGILSDLKRWEKAFDYQPGKPIYFGSQGNYRAWGFPSLEGDEDRRSSVLTDAGTLRTTLRLGIWRYNLAVQVEVGSEDTSEQYLDVTCAGVTLGTLDCSSKGLREGLFAIPRSCLGRETDGNWLLDLKLVARNISHYGGGSRIRIRSVVILDLLALPRLAPVNEGKRKELPVTAFAVFSQGWYEIEKFNNRYVRWLGPSLTGQMSAVGNVARSDTAVFTIALSNIGDRYGETQLLLGNARLSPCLKVESEGNNFLVYSLPGHLGTAPESRLDFLALEVAGNAFPGNNPSTDGRKVSILVGNGNFYKLQHKGILMFEDYVTVAVERWELDLANEIDGEGWYEAFEYDRGKSARSIDGRATVNFKGYCPGSLKISVRGFSTGKENFGPGMLQLRVNNIKVKWAAASVKKRQDLWSYEARIAPDLLQAAFPVQLALERTVESELAIASLHLLPEEGSDDC